MPNDPPEDEMPFQTRCDLLEKELKSTLEDLAKIRKADLAEVTHICLMIRASLSNAQHYLAEIHHSLKEQP
jgi:hypothetical protein